MKSKFVTAYFLYKIFTLIIHGDATTLPQPIKLMISVKNQKMATKDKLSYKEMLHKECKYKCFNDTLCVSYDSNEKLRVCEIQFTKGHLHHADGWTHGTKTIIQVY